MDKNLFILLLTFASAIAAFGLGYVQYLSAKEDQVEAEKSKEESLVYQQKLELTTSDDQKTLDELANAYKKNADQEKEFRLNLTGGNNMPQLNILIG